MASKQSQSRGFIILAIAFLALSVTSTSSRAVWLSLGTVFLVIGIIRRREANEQTPPSSAPRG